MQLSCGNKVSPASLVTSSDTNCTSSTEPGYVSGMESQHSQTSLFSGSEATSSLELFSQPLSSQPECANPPQTSVSRSKLEQEQFHSDNLSQPTSETAVAGRKKYYMNYLYLHSNTAKSAVASTELVEPVSSKMDFEVWKAKQHSKSERKNEIAAIVSEASRKVNEQVIEELKASIETLHESNEKQSSQQWGEQITRLFTQLLQGQEETNLAVQQMKTELTKQQSIIKSLSTQLSAMATADTHNTLSFVANKIISGVSATLKSAFPACRMSVSTQTDEVRFTHTDQTVPEGADIVNNNTTRDENMEQQDRNSPPRHSDACSGKNELRQCLSEKRFHQTGTLVQQEPLTPMKEQSPSLLQTTIGQKRQPTKTHGKRKNETTQLKMARSKKIPCRTSSTSKTTRERTKLPTPSAVTRRQSKRTLKKPLKYKGDSDDEKKSVLSPLNNTEPHHSKGTSTGIRRRASKRLKTNRNSSFESSSAHSSSGVGDMFCSGTSSHESQSYPANPPPETKTMVKFERSNEDAKRRKMVISNLTDPELLLREIQNCIFSRVDSDPSP